MIIHNNYIKLVIGEDRNADLACAHHSKTALIHTESVLTNIQHLFALPRSLINNVVRMSLKNMNSKFNSCVVYYS